MFHRNVHQYETEINKPPEFIRNISCLILPKCYNKYTNEKEVTIWKIKKLATY